MAQYLSDIFEDYDRERRSKHPFQSPALQSFSDALSAPGPGNPYGETWSGMPSMGNLGPGDLSFGPGVAPMAGPEATGSFGVAAPNGGGGGGGPPLTYGDPLGGFQGDYTAGIGTRRLPLAQGYQQQISAIVRSLGPEYDIRVVSAGQSPNGPHTGSTRHNVDASGVGHTSDLILTRNGKDVRPGDDPELYAQLFERAAPYFPGMGHYAWGVHIGGGTPAFWGPSTTSSDANPLFAAAYNRGRAQPAGEILAEPQPVQGGLYRGIPEDTKTVWEDTSAQDWAKNYLSDAYRRVSPGLYKFQGS